jgi:phosphatidylglycerophosphate synthase
LTILSVLAGAAFVVFWLSGQRIAAMIALAFHVALDGLDGPLARHQSLASPRGSFTDSFCDQIVVTAVTICLMIGTPPLLGIAAGALYLVLYNVVVAIAMVRNSLGIPFTFLIRPRFALFAAIPFAFWLWPWVVTAVVWGSNAILATHVATGFFHLRRRLRGPESSTRRSD